MHRTNTFFHITKAGDSNIVNRNHYLLNVVYREAGGSIRGVPEIYLLTAASRPALESTQTLSNVHREPFHLKYSSRNAKLSTSLSGEVNSLRHEFFAKYYINHHHHHHFPERLGVFPVP